MTIRSLNEWLSYFEHRSAAEIELGLTRIQTVAERLKLLPVKVPVISVAGTNGKGSTVATLEALYCEAGYRVGAYTSPHLLCFNERIRLNQQLVTDDFLCKAFSQIEYARDTIHLTYFEMATLAALMYFEVSCVDVVILEVGLGGRLDATNIVDANLAIITTIDFDHEAYLGNTLDAIGSEKAGIFRPNQIGLYADSQMPLSIGEKANALSVKLLKLNEHYRYRCDGERIEVFNQADDPLVLPKPNIQLNAAVSALIAISQLQEILPIDSFAMARAMQSVFIAGRQQIIYGTICTVFDVSHNPQSVKLLAQRMKSLLMALKPSKVRAVFSGLSDKNLLGLITPMLPFVDEWYTAVLKEPRAARAFMLEEAFAQSDNAVFNVFSSILEAYQVAKQLSCPGDILVVYGSFFVVSPVMLFEKGEVICNG
jgi:dihydrofolate synthase/folylpolyglutamate synthase